jgi:hypothetical protein
MGMGPLSIATSVGGLLTICYQAGIVLKDFYFAIEIIDTSMASREPSRDSLMS